jgi:hypothetical protein
MENRKDEMKKKWKILEYLENENVMVEETLPQTVELKEKKYSISRLRKLFKAV